jgi:RNA polymerase sigma-70 factor, ECF subfamily
MKIISLFIGLMLCMQGAYASSLDLYYNNDKFQIYCSENTEQTVDKTSYDLEKFYTKMSREFDHYMIDPIEIIIYPNIKSFHKAIGEENAPEWLVASCINQKIKIVSPDNPGTCHTRSSINKIMKLSIVKAMITDKYGNVPFWLTFGLGAIKADFTYHKSPEEIPSLDQLETLMKKNDFEEFSKIHGYSISYYFVKFIQDTYGEDFLLRIIPLHNIYKEGLYDEWRESLL